MKGPYQAREQIVMPWEVAWWEVNDSDGKSVFRLTSQEDATRIALCLTFCDGLTDEALKDEICRQAFHAARKEPL